MEDMENYGYTLFRTIPKILLLIEFCFITNLIRFYIILAYRVLFQ